METLELTEQSDGLLLLPSPLPYMSLTHVLETGLSSGSVPPIVDRFHITQSGERLAAAALQFS